MKKNEIYNRFRIRNKKENIYRVKKNRYIIKLYILIFIRCNVVYICICM